MKTKKFTFEMIYQVIGTKSVEVPKDFTQEQAEKYIRDHWDEISLPSEAEYITGSDEPDFENSSFEENKVG